MKLEDLQPNASVRGIATDSFVTVVSTEWHGSDALTLVYRDPAGRVADEILYRHDEPRLEVLELGRPWSFDGDGALFRLAHLTVDGAAGQAAADGSAGEEVVARDIGTVAVFDLCRQDDGGIAGTDEGIGWVGRCHSERHTANRPTAPASYGPDSDTQMGG